MSNTPVLSAFTGSVLGQTAELQWTQVSTIYSNSVVFYGKNEPIDEIRNISMDSNVELVNLIEDRLNNLV